MTRRRSERAERGGAWGLSVKSLRVLERWGVTKAFEEGATVVAVGPAYRFSDGGLVRLAFSRDEAGRLCVGCAIDEGTGWVIEEAEPYSARTLGYYQRHLRRKGIREWPGEDGEE